MGDIKGDNNLVNKVIFRVDNNSFNDCLNKLRKAKSELKSFSKSCGKLGKGFGDYNVIGKQAEKISQKIANAQARMQAARIKYTTSQMTAQNKELQSMRRFYREQEKLSAKAAKQSAMIQNSRRAQAVAGLTAKNPELDKMRAYYQQQEKASNRVGNAAVIATAARKNQVQAKYERLTGMFDGTTIARYQRQIQSLNAAYLKGGMASVVYNAKMQKIINSMRKASAEADSCALSVGKTTAGFKKAAVGIAATAYILQRAISSSIKTQTEYNSSYYGLLGLNKDNQKLTDDQLAWASNKAKYYGSGELTTRKAYMQLRGATMQSLDEQTTRGIFDAFLAKSTASGQNDEQRKLSLQAISQMASKGTVQAEELKSQLAEHGIPSAIRDFAEAYNRSIGGKANMSDQDMINQLNGAMKKGNVKFAKIAPFLTEIWASVKDTKAFADSLQQADKEINRTRDSFNRLQLAFMGTVDSTDDVTSLSESLNNTMKGLSFVMEDLQPAAKMAGEWLGNAIDGFVGNAIIACYIIKDEVGKLAEILDKFIPESVQEGLKGLAEKIAYLGGAAVALKAAKGILTLTRAIRGLIGILALGGMLGGGGDITKPQKGKGKMGKVGKLAGKLGVGAVFRHPLTWAALFGMEGADMLNSYWQNPEHWGNPNDSKRPAWMQGIIDRVVGNPNQLKESYAGLNYTPGYGYGSFRGGAMDYKPNKTLIDQKVNILVDGDKLGGVFRAEMESIVKDSWDEAVDKINSSSGYESTKE